MTYLWGPEVTSYDLVRRPEVTSYDLLRGPEVTVFRIT